MFGVELHWIVFSIVVLFFLFLDLGIFHKKNEIIKIKEAVTWSAVWIIVALAFAAGIYFLESKTDSILFLTGYVVEKSLSVDNLFLFVVIFKHFNIPKKYQHKILFWGIVGAIVTRGLIIWAGISLIQRYDWLTYIFGIFIVYIGYKTAFTKEEDFDITEKKYYALIKKYIPVAWSHHGPEFFIKRGGKIVLTPLMMALIVVEISDILFALDSVPAILSITTDSFIVYTSNLFAILGLRSLYFVLAEMMDKFAYLSVGVSAILVIVGVKILIKDFYHFPEGLMLLIIFVILSASMIYSVRKSKEGEGV